MITLISTPSKALYGSVISRWSSNRQPFLFNFVRKDAIYSSITNYFSKSMIRKLLSFLTKKATFGLSLETFCWH